MKPSEGIGAKEAPVSRVWMPQLGGAAVSDGFVMGSAVIARVCIENLSTLDYSGASEERDLTGRGGLGAGAVLCAAVFCGAWNPAAAQADGVNASSYSFQDAGASQEAGAGDKETVMTKQQAKELFDSVDKIMAFASGDTGLAGVAHVKRKLISRDEVNKYLIKNFDEDESSKRLQRSEIVLKKFGMLSQDFDLRPFLLSLLTEQIAGFYDDKTKTVNLLNWIEPDEQKPVLAHELTHAIQDQKVGLEKWSSDPYKGISKTASEDNERIAVDELETARQAVAEGQAMVVFIDWSIRDTGKTLAESPEVWDKTKDAIADTSGSPVMARAPLLLQRSLEFPYTDGLAFEHMLETQPGGKQLAFAGALERPPNSSFEVMHPAAYLAHAPVPVLRMPDVHGLLDAEYEPYDVGVMGELDVEMMASLFGGPQISKALTPQWDGGIYYAAQRRDATAAQKAATASLGVFYLSKWHTAEAATGFEGIYEAELGRKYDKLKERKADEADSREKVFSTEEGDVLLSRSGDEFFVSEGFPLAVARTLRDSAVDAQGTGPVRIAAEPGGELTLRLAEGMERFGMMKSALR
jgi:hypothetical protein